jgi:hypothetical protein
VTDETWVIGGFFFNFFIFIFHRCPTEPPSGPEIRNHSPGGLPSRGLPLMAEDSLLLSRFSLLLTARFPFPLLQHASATLIQQPPAEKKA